jgi:hypothetical protein
MFQGSLAGCGMSTLGGLGSTAGGGASSPASSAAAAAAAAAAAYGGYCHSLLQAASSASSAAPPTSYVDWTGSSSAAGMSTMNSGQTFQQMNMSGSQPSVSVGSASGANSSPSSAASMHHISPFAPTSQAPGGFSPYSQSGLLSARAAHTAFAPMYNWC